MNFKWSTVKEATEAIKNICTLLLYLALTAFFVFFIWPKRNDYEPGDNQDFLGWKWNRKKNSSIITVNKVPVNVNEAKDTFRISSETYEAAKFIDTALYIDDQSWIYLGQIVDRKLTNSHWKITSIPHNGDHIVALDAVYKRKNFPIELEPGKWQLGDIRGVVGDNESVNIIDVKEIADQNFWALVR